MDRRVVSSRDSIYGDKPAPQDYMRRPYDSRLFRLHLKELCGVQYGLVRGERLRKRINDSNWRTLLLVILRRPRRLYGGLNASCADVRLDRVGLWAGNAQHK